MNNRWRLVFHSIRKVAYMENILPQSIMKWCIVLNQINRDYGITHLIDQTITTWLLLDCLTKDISYCYECLWRTPHHKVPVCIYMNWLARRSPNKLPSPTVTPSRNLSNVVIHLDTPYPYILRHNPKKNISSKSVNYCSSPSKT